jgi:hypothetical protein
MGSGAARTKDGTAFMVAVSTSLSEAVTVVKNANVVIENENGFRVHYAFGDVPGSIAVTVLTSPPAVTEQSKSPYAKANANSFVVATGTSMKFKTGAGAGWIYGMIYEPANG